MSLGRPSNSEAARGQILAPTPVHAAATASIPPLSFTKGEVAGFVRNGVNNVGTGGAAAAEGLLSLRLKSLGMQNVCRQETDEQDDDMET